MKKPFPNDSWQYKAVQLLSVDEGVRAEPYKDTKGLWTIGVGHLIGKDLYKLSLSDRVIHAMLLEDMEIAWDTVHRVFGSSAVNSWKEARQLAFLSLAFNLGNKLGEFKRTIGAVLAENWDEASNHLTNSLWAKQVGNRAERLIYMVKTGNIHEDYC